MASKSFSTQATVLSLKPIGENNSSVCLITCENEIIYATLYGGTKSKLKSLVSPWNSGEIFLNENPQNHFIKITDFDVKNYHLSFRESLQKSLLASLAAEIAIKSKCCGKNEFFWSLFSGFINGLEAVSDNSIIQAGSIRFLWRFLELSGLQPDISQCETCEKPFIPLKNFGDKVSCTKGGANYSISGNSFICTECESKKSQFYLDEEAVKYLAYVTMLPPKDAQKLPVSDEALQQLKGLIYFLAENATGTHLNSLITTQGIL